MIKKIGIVIASLVLLVGLIAISGFVSAPGWFIDLEVVGEGLLIILLLRGRRSRPVGY